MATFADAPAGDLAVGEKIFKTKCAQCHVAEKGGGHKQVYIESHFSLLGGLTLDRLHLPHGRQGFWLVQTSTIMM